MNLYETIIVVWKTKDGKRVSLNRCQSVDFVGATSVEDARKKALLKATVPEDEGTEVEALARPFECRVA